MARINLRIPRTIGFGAGLFALSLCIFSAVGAVWGLLRPELTGYASDEGGYVLETVANVEFQSYITFALITAVLAMLVALATYIRAPEHRTAATVYWLGLVALAATAAFYVLGGVTATHPPEEPGEIVHFVPTFNPGVAWAAAPFTAMFTYWCALFVGNDEQWANPQQKFEEASSLASAHKA